MSFLCRGVGEGGHAVGEVAFAVGDGFLVAHGGVDVAVAGTVAKGRPLYLIGDSGTGRPTC